MYENFVWGPRAGIIITITIIIMIIIIINIIIVILSIIYSYYYYYCFYFYSYLKYDTCAWTPNKVFIHFLLVSVETARVLLQSWWARLSTGASREAPVDNECLGKSRQV